MRIAVIAAPNPGYLNIGMLTVDLAAAGLLARALPHARVSWYTLHPPDQLVNIHRSLEPSELPFEWRPLVARFDEVCDHDVILLWGDFLQARHYFVEDAAERLIQSSNHMMSADEALEVLYRCLLFRDVTPEILNKIVIFGSTILFNRQTDYSGDRYGEYLFRLFRNCAGVWAREPVSAAKIQHVRQDYTSSFLGTDCAFLLRDEDIARLSTTEWMNGHPFADRLGLFFGTRTRPPRGLISFLRQIARPLGLELEWVPWAPVHEWLLAVPRRFWLNPLIAAYIISSRRTINRLMSRGTGYSAGDVLTAIGRYRLIVTDTYHLSINAWRVGTPAICLGSAEGAPKQQSLNDYKKRVFYEMYDAADYYFSTSVVDHRPRRRLAVQQIVRIIEDDSIASAIAGRIRTHARSVEQRLVERLSGLAITPPLAAARHEDEARHSHVASPPAPGRGQPGHDRMNRRGPVSG